jgi:GxxExxY protein
MKPQRAQRTLCSPEEFPLKDVTERIISCAIEVHKALGPGLLENVYEEALAYEFTLTRKLQLTTENTEEIY